LKIAHDSWADVYDRVYEESFGSFYSNLTLKTLETIEGLAPVGCEILDIGAGTGRLSIPLSEKGFVVTAIEPSEGMLNVLSQKKQSKTVQTYNTNIQGLYLDKTFPFVVCVFSVFCYLTSESDLDQAIEAIAAHTSIGGSVLIDITSLEAFGGMSYQSEELIREVEVGEEDIELGLFRYKETIHISSNEGNNQYGDEFFIKYWQSDLVLDKFSKHGFNLKLNLSDQFSGSGAQYFVLRKDS